MTTDTTGWFAALGAPFGMAAADAGARLVASLPAFVSPTIERVHRAPDVVRALRAIEAEGAWWDLQESEREAVWTLAADTMGEDVLLERIVVANAQAADLVRAIDWPKVLRADPTLGDAAREAVLLVAHQSALATAASARQHWFCAHRALYEAGHWPLGMLGGRLLVF